MQFYGKKSVFFNIYGKMRKNIVRILRNYFSKNNRVSHTGSILNPDILPVCGLQNFLSGIVISVKILGLKFVPYLAENTSLRLKISKLNHLRIKLGLQLIESLRLWQILQTISYYYLRSNTHFFFVIISIMFNISVKTAPSKLIMAVQSSI